MDTLSRLILVAVLVIAVLGTPRESRAYGVTGQSSQPVAGWLCGGSGGAFSTDPVAACQAYLSRTFPVSTETFCNPPGDTVTRTTNKTAVSYDAGTGKVTVNVQVTGCPVGGASSTEYLTPVPSTENVVQCPSDSRNSSEGQCICNKGLRPGANGTSCVPYQCAPVGTHDAFTRPDVKVSTAETTQCVGGCEVAVNSITPDQSGQLWAQWPFTSLGADKTCGGLSAPAAVPKPKDKTGETTGTAAPLPCKAGEYSGTFNGMNVCVPSSGAVTTAVDTVNPDGSIEHETTTCLNKSCTTKKETIDASGVTTGGSTVIGKSGVDAPGATGGSSSGSGDNSGEETKQGLDSFCTANPNSAMCGKSMFGGSCASTTCTGDAVQCQIAQEQARRNCELLDAAPPGDTAVIAAAGGSRPAGHPGGAPQSISLGGGFDQTDIVAGSCPADQVIQVSSFQPVTLPFASLCGPAQWLGNILVGLTALSCLGIVFVRGG